MEEIYVNNSTTATTSGYQDITEMATECIICGRPVTIGNSLEQIKVCDNCKDSIVFVKAFRNELESLIRKLYNGEI